MNATNAKVHNRQIVVCGWVHVIWFLIARASFNKHLCLWGRAVKSVVNTSRRLRLDCLRLLNRFLIVSTYSITLSMGSVKNCQDLGVVR